ncbi:MAG: alkaline phosphatase family protein [Candidatus Delongbacteria bacterium]|nr:alkaline phosphatase family protein [Candidatus Delongbacteria bacterium]
MMKHTIICLFLCILMTPGIAQNYQLPSGHPRLVVGIVIDGLGYDDVQKNLNLMHENGMKKLMKQGAFCKNARHNYMFTQRAPGYATIVTGSEPSWHGIVSDFWYETLKEEGVHAVQNKDYYPVGTVNKDNACSPEQLMTETFSDAIKMYFQNQSKVYSISLDATAAVLNGGFKADAAYWVDDFTGNFVSSSYYMEQLPGWVKTFNENKYTDIYFERTWEPLDTLAAYTHSRPDSNAFEYGFDAEFKTFPFVYEEIKSHYTGKSFIKMIPEGNTMTTDFAVHCLIQENLGTDEVPDVLMVNYHVGENIGKYFGPNSKQMQDIILRLDKEITHFVEVIEDRIGKNSTLFFLTSPSGFSSNPEYRKTEKLPGGTFKHHYMMALLKSYLNVSYGKGDWIRDYHNQQIYLNRTLIEDAGLDLAEVQNKVAQFILSTPGVANVLTATNLQRTDYSSGIFMKMQNSYHQKRSGDVIIALKPGWIKDVSYTADHNTCYNYDAHVPLMFYGWKIKKGEISQYVTSSGITPSICNMMNIPGPASVGNETIEGITR